MNYVRFLILWNSTRMS